jgi:branched-chain amino acid aminotransferase
MEIKTISAQDGQLKEKPKDEKKLGFGNYFTDHIFMMNYDAGKGWHSPRVEPYGDLHLDPAALSLHYGQEIFEGLKAYRGADDSIYLFRPEMNIKRLNQSASRLCMPGLDIDQVMEGLKALILMDQEWIPGSEGTSLYIRPVMLATEAHVGVRPSNSYLFYIILSPVGAYYAEGLNPVKIHIETEYIRAAMGGIGEAKAAANYAASMLATEKAKEKGFSQVLWLDAIEKKYIEEVGTMNIFFVIGDEVITPPIAGSILPGITRDSVIKLIQDWGMKITERPISIDELITASKDGTVREIFGTGTAAVISPVGEIEVKGERYVVAGGKMGELSKKLYDEIVGIQYGTNKDPNDWRVKID